MLVLWLLAYRLLGRLLAFLVLLPHLEQVGVRRLLVADQATAEFVELERGVAQRLARSGLAGRLDVEAGRQDDLAACSEDVLDFRLRVVGGEPGLELPEAVAVPLPLRDGRLSGNPGVLPVLVDDPVDGDHVPTEPVEAHGLAEDHDDHTHDQDEGDQGTDHVEHADVPRDAFHHFDRRVQDADDREGDGIVLEADAEDLHQLEGADGERVETPFPVVEPLFAAVGREPGVDDRVLVVPGRVPVDVVADAHGTHREREALRHDDAPVPVGRDELHRRQAHQGDDAEHHGLQEPVHADPLAGGVEPVQGLHQPFVLDDHDRLRGASIRRPWRSRSLVGKG